MLRLTKNSLGMAIILSPIYVFPSGNPQPADFLIVLAALFLLFEHARAGTRIKGGKDLAAVAMLVVWVFVVNALWEVVYPREEWIKYPLFFAFNLVLMIVLLNIKACQNEFRKWLAVSAQFALILSFVGIVISFVAPGMFGTKENYRIIGFYNNPNQLAFNHLCLIGALLLSGGGKIPQQPIAFLAFVLGVMGIAAAASLAAMGGVLVMIAGIFLSSVSSKRIIYFFVLFVCAVGGFAVVDYALENQISAAVIERSGALDRKLDNLSSERKYERIMAFPEYWFFGAAEGGHERFYPYTGGEIHSSFGLLLFCYGLPGLILFMWFLWRVARMLPLGSQLVLASLLVYSITHMGLRTTTFWMFMAVALRLSSTRYSQYKVSNSNKQLAAHSKLPDIDIDGAK